MLVLSRKINESICVGGDIKVTVVRVHQGRVQLGIDAPLHITVNREEVQKLMEENSDRDSAGRS